MLQSQIDQLVDTLRECRVVLVAEDLLDGDLEDAIRESLENLGVDDPEEN